MIQQKLQELGQVLQNEKLDSGKFDEILYELYELRNEEQFKKGMKDLRSNLKIISTSCTMQGRGYEKKYGYAGDFEMIDKIYTKHISASFPESMWDQYFHKQPAPNAVRNRKKYFVSKMRSIYKDEPTTILNLASGPCRDILELLELYDNPKIYFDCVELDKQAIQYGKDLLDSYKTNVSFINKNIYRFIPNKQYDVIWSAGLFDYFDDKTFVAILKRLINTNNGNKIIIGNFSDENPTTPYMEIIGEWFLNYRSKEKLISLAMEAGAPKDKITIESEPEKVNLFLNIN